MKKILTFILILTVLVSGFCIAVHAEEPDYETENTANAEDTENKNFYEIIYGAFRDNSEKITSALAAIASLVLAFCYKRGLMPSVKGATNKLCDLVSKVKDASEEQAETAKELLYSAEEKLLCARDSIEKLNERLMELEKELSESLADKDEREKMKLILMAQTEMLYDIFMTSALPQYQKDIVGERTARMKEQLNVGG